MIPYALRRAAFAAAILAPAALTSQAAPAITVGPNVQVSADRARLPHYEHLAGAHARDANKMMACAMVGDPPRGHDYSVVYTTVDGGKSWRHTLDADPVKGLTGDPVCMYGQGDTAYFVVLTTVAPRRMLVMRSLDAGLTWNKAADMPFIDRENLIVDQTGGKYNGRIYINGTGTAPGMETGTPSAVTLFHSTDGGMVFAGPALRVTLPPMGGIEGMGNSVVLSDGTFVTIFGEVKQPGAIEDDNLRRGAIAWLRAVTSKDGGETLTPATVVSDWYMARNRSQGSHVPWLAVDPGTKAYKDRLYAVWDDYREGRLTVLLSYSSDKGKTWSKPVHVVDDRAAPNPDEGPDNINALVAVNASGVVGVSWNDRRDYKDDLGWDLRFAASYDGGESFTPSVKVSSAPNRYGSGESWPIQGSSSGGGTRIGENAQPSKNPLSVTLRVNNFFYSSGHTSGLVVTADGVFHPVWEDNRTGTSQLWTAPVTAHGAAVEHGAAELATLTDATDQVMIEVTGATYDRGSGTASAQLRLKNTSKDTIVGPVKARVVALNSDLGVPQIVGADNGTGRAGAIFDLTALIAGGRLLPDSVSAPRTLTVRLSDVRPFKQGQLLKFGLVALDARVYAGAVKGARERAEKP
jgi:hypothetical protein